MEGTADASLLALLSIALTGCIAIGHGIVSFSQFEIIGQVDSSAIRGQEKPVVHIIETSGYGSYDDILGVVRGVSESEEGWKRAEIDAEGKLQVEYDQESHYMAVDWMILPIPIGIPFRREKAERTTHTLVG